MKIMCCLHYFLRSSKDKLWYYGINAAAGSLVVMLNVNQLD